MINTTAFIEALTSGINSIVSCYYQKAPADDNGNVLQSVFPYAVVSGVLVTPLNGGECGDLCSFYVDVWTDEKLSDSTIQLEQLCDGVRNSLHNAILTQDGIFYAHIGFDSQSDMTEAEFDLSHRRLSFSGRIFYIGG